MPSSAKQGAMVRSQLPSKLNDKKQKQVARKNSRAADRQNKVKVSLPLKPISMISKLQDEADKYSSFPPFVVKKSKIIKGGRGVFLNKGINSLPADTIIPIAGRFFKKKQRGTRAVYQFKVTKGFFCGISRQVKDMPVGSFVNRVVSQKIYDSLAYEKYRRTKGKRKPIQDLTEKNALIIRLGCAVYIKLVMEIRQGDEVLIPYNRRV